MHLAAQVIGRVAPVISSALQGKDRPDYTPQSDGGDVVVVVNADQAVFTGKKMQDKVYYRHMGKPGNLRESSPEEKKEQFGGAELIWQAVNGMLPKNKLRKVSLATLLCSPLLQVVGRSTCMCDAIITDKHNCLAFQYCTKHEPARSLPLRDLQPASQTYTLHQPFPPRIMNIIATFHACLCPVCSTPAHPTR